MMTDFTARPELSGVFGAVASTHWIASATGMRLLEDGGNSFVVETGAAFLLKSVEPPLNGPGGDFPRLDAGHNEAEPTVICGQGFSPAPASLNAFKALEL